MREFRRAYKRELAVKSQHIGCICSLERILELLHMQTVHCIFQRNVIFNCRKVRIQHTPSSEQHTFIKMLRNHKSEHALFKPVCLNLSQSSQRQIRVRSGVLQPDYTSNMEGMLEKLPNLI